jgi:hypothetical protein
MLLIVDGSSHMEGYIVNHLDLEYVQKLEKALLEYICICGLSESALDAISLSGNHRLTRGLKRNGTVSLHQLTLRVSELKSPNFQK